ncbi:DUF2164 domain-containing protein [Clostridium sp. 19966]|uniref:DUF2164 domain-containing protein n=1 Tax=Clostridium sp. 19966 TaxID=2768166 RepID=UPI0028DF5BC6|nr:DUF2164 domain-containing protein [Clostridium sp. 19966]MDT8718831.1 DUF2164 domain-containing protein [Clostridium sp. 19966]
MKKRTIELSKEKRQLMIGKIQDYFYTEREEEVGELAASFILDFIIEEIAPEFYNEGINAAYRYMNERVEDMLGMQK